MQPICEASVVHEDPATDEEIREQEVGTAEDESEEVSIITNLLLNMN